MRPAAIAVRILISITGVSLLGLGVLFWLGHALALIHWHVLLGGFLVLLLWFVAALALRAGASKGLILLLLAGSLVMPALGIMQLRLLPGQYHWLIRALHLAVGVGVVELGHAVVRRLLTPSVWTAARAARHRTMGSAGALPVSSAGFDGDKQ